MLVDQDDSYNHPGKQQLPLKWCHVTRIDVTFSQMALLNIINLKTKT